MHIDEKQFKGVIVETGLISRSDIDTLAIEAKRKGVPLPTYLVTTGKLTALDVRRLEGQILGISFVDLTSEKIPFSILSKIPEPIVRMHSLVAFKEEEGVLSVAVLTVESLSHINFLTESEHIKIRPYFTSYESIKTAQLNYQKELKKRYGESIAKDVATIKENKVSEFRNDRQVLRELERQSQDAASVRLVETLINHARAHHATNIHIEPLAEHIVVRYRIGGTLHEALLLAKDVLESLVSRMKFLAQLPLVEKNTAHHGVFTIQSTHEKIVGHISIVPTVHGERLTIRLKQGGNGSSLESLGFHGDTLEHIEKILHTKNGAVLVAGPRGSGVTTTLYALLEAIQTPHTHTTTIEGTIETTLAKATQLLTRPEFGFDTHAGVKAALKGDSDILMVSELTTAEVATTALRTVTLGRRLIAGVRTHSAIEALTDLIAVGVTPELIISSVKMVIGTRLVPALGAEKEKYYLEKSEIKTLGKMVNLPVILETLKNEHVVKGDATWETIPFYRAKSKIKQLHTKVIGIHEVLTLSRGITEALSASKDYEAIEKIVRAEGQLSMLEDGLIKAVRGDIALEEVLKIVSR